MKNIFLQYVIILATSIILDSIWLGLIAKSFYKENLGFIMSDSPNIKVALLFYLVFAIAVMVFIISPALSDKYSTGKVFLYGALLGLVIYGGYDFTNQAIIKNWPVIVTVVDLLWGILMSSLTVTISYFFIKLFSR